MQSTEYFILDMAWKHSVDSESIQSIVESSLLSLRWPPRNDTFPTAFSAILRLICKDIWVPGSENNVPYRGLDLWLGSTGLELARSQNVLDYMTTRIYPGRPREMLFIIDIWGLAWTSIGLLDFPCSDTNQFWGSQLGRAFSCVVFLSFFLFF